MGRPLPKELASAILGKDGIVILGMPGAWAEENTEQSDNYTTKIGGIPDWPISPNEISSDLLKCGVCGGDLGLVAQVYAPLETNGICIEDRTLYLFGCPAQNCGISPLSWRTIRVQRDNTDSSKSSSVNGSSFTQGSTSTNSNSIRAQTVDRANEEEQYQSSEADEWWDDDIWRPADGDEGDAYGALDMQELGRALQEAGYMAANQHNNQNANSNYTIQSVSSQSGSNIDNHQFGNQNDDVQFVNENNSNNANMMNFVINNLPVLPCFYIFCQNEIYPPPSNSPLSEPYQRQNTSPENVDEFWQGEEYEPSSALNADRTYLKFKKRLDFCPEQCFRYSFGGKPLLASRDQGDPGICSLCGGPRIYEMQLMPPLLFYLQQACRDMASSYSANNWEWLTILLYTCAQSCSSSRGRNTGEKEWVVVEEATLVQYET